MKTTGIIGLLIGTLFLATACTDHSPIRIGVSAQYTGKQAELGIQQRNGAIMAADEINQRGGINGRPLEMITADDLGTPEGAVAADKGLIEKGVICIIGHATSGQSLAALPVIEEANMVLMSPTSSSSELSGRDDHFIRIIQSLIDRARGIADYIYETAKVKELAVFYDIGNKAYSENYLQHFLMEYTGSGGVVAYRNGFDSKEKEVEYDGMIEKARSSGAKGLMIIASDADTAYIAQRCRIMGWNVPLYSSAWAQTDVLIKNGGKAVEGMVLEQSYLLQSKSPKYLAFQKAYRERFGHEPSFSAAFGYETVLTLETALKKNGGKQDGLKEALLGIKNLEGLTDSFSIDSYGDVIRPYYLGYIKNGEYVDMIKKQ